MLNVACTLRSSTEYDAEYVERLQAGLKKHLPVEHKLICLSDVPVPCERIPLKSDWPGWWSKLELFDPDLNDDLLYFDLDTVIVGDLSEIANIRMLTLLSDFNDLDKSNSGMMFLPWFERSLVWNTWIKDPEGIMKRRGRGRGDGEFLREVYGNRPARWQDEIPGQVVSYKEHVRGKEFPKDARVVCFHGRPRPRDVGWLDECLFVS